MTPTYPYLIIISISAFVAVVSFYIVSRKRYSLISKSLHFLLLFVIGFIWQQFTLEGFLKKIYFTTAPIFEWALGDIGQRAEIYGPALAIAGAFIVMLGMVIYLMLIGYLVGSCLAITRCALFGTPRTKWI